MTDIPPETKIWRYMDLAKFVSMLATRTLYFACQSEFEDQWEGYVTESEVQAIKNRLTRRIDRVTRIQSENVKESLLRRMKSRYSAQVGWISSAPAYTGVSCWHENDTESDAMWKLYSLAGQGIAIESTAGRLSKSLKGRTHHIGSVMYIDFDKVQLKMLDLKHVLRKRQSFEHEREIRALITISPPAKGAPVPCDLDILIKAVHISPLADNCFLEAVKAVCCGTVGGIRVEPTQSQLHVQPDRRGLEALKEQAAKMFSESATS